MIQQLIYDRFGVLYNVFYIAQLLKNLGFSYQKAAFVSDHLDERKRHECQQDRGATEDQDRSRKTAAQQIAHHAAFCSIGRR